MFYIPGLEKLVQWLKDYAKPIKPWFYWGGVLTIGFVGAMTIDAWRDYGFRSASPLLLAMLIIMLLWFLLSHLKRFQVEETEKKEE